jgi:hypothetical protein
MERSAVYRRALAPIMVWNGLVGIIGGLVGWKAELNAAKFVEFWSVVAVLAIIGSFLLVRRQALKDSEPFWSPPTRRIAQALLPPLFIGAFFNALTVCISQKEGSATDDDFLIMILVLCWLLLYGCAAHGAGFFMTRGMKLFGWMFIFIGCGIMAATFFGSGYLPFSASLLMAATFGGLHLAYGIYLYLTEKGKNAA